MRMMRSFVIGRIIIGIVFSHAVSAALLGE